MHLQFVCFILLLLSIAACGSVPQRPERLETSSYGCMNAVLRQKLPEGLTDAQAHCIASGLVARYCSVAEANLAGFGKEVRDLFTRGDASWADWRADRRGIACARNAQDDAGVVTCCRGELE